MTSTTNPQADYFSPEYEIPDMISALGQGADFWNKSKIYTQYTYYGRARTSDNKKNQIHVNALGIGIGFTSGYAWDTVGFDMRLNSNLGRGNGWSEVLLHDVDKDTDRSNFNVGEAALKAKLGQPDAGLEFRGGYLPIRIGTLGTLGGLHPHSYRGFEVKALMGDFWLGYGWADRFHNEWDNKYRKMTTAWHQNRGSFAGKAPDIDHIHSIGGRYSFGPDKKAFVDAGVGEGKGYRKNAQFTSHYPLKLQTMGDLTFTTYALWGKYKEEKSHIRYPKNEYHYSTSAELKTGNWYFFGAYGQTHSPDSGEMNFRMTAWANSDNRNFIQTWLQLDDFVWNGQKVIQAGIGHEIGKLIGLPGFSLSGRFNYGWNMRVPGREARGKAWEFNGGIQYAVPDGMLKGVTFGIYPARLRTRDFYIDGYGKQSRDDIKVVISYATTFDMNQSVKKESAPAR
ncbi:MAG: OprD family porin [Betaproteobacteria bacterium]|nr:OprD family porin [Betaproteobacteria bacterium]